MVGHVIHLGYLLKIDSDHALLILENSDVAGHLGELDFSVFELKVLQYLRNRAIVLLVEGNINLAC